MREIRHTICDPDHFRFPRQSGLPAGYFRRAPEWPMRYLRALAAWGAFAGVALFLGWFAMMVAR